MLLRNKPIRKKLMTVILLTSSVVLLVTCTSFFLYEYYSFRRAAIYQLTLLGKIIALNSTAALAFSNAEDAEEILSSLDAEPHIFGGVLYNNRGDIFAKYPSDLNTEFYPASPEVDGVDFGKKYVTGYLPVVQGDTRLGTVFLVSDKEGMYNRFKLYVIIALSVICVSLIVAYLLSVFLQRNLSMPILDLARTARIISEENNYAHRAIKYDNDEIGFLTDAFNRMLTRIEDQNREIIDFNRELEQKVKERTLDLEAAYREMEAFSYSVSHDLHAPLRQIDGYINIYLTNNEERIDAGGMKTLRSVTRNVLKMRQLIDDLLVFSQLSRREIKKVEVPVNKIVHQIYEQFEERDKDRTVTFKTEELPNAFGDMVTLEQVWENLISNALKYSKHRDPAVIEIGSIDQGDKLCYFIKDNGAGFDMQYYNALFAPFQRLHSNVDFEGTGVGLATVDRIITKHGGRVWAESMPGEGATFYFTLPKS